MKHAHAHAHAHAHDTCTRTRAAELADFLGVARGERDEALLDTRASLVLEHRTQPRCEQRHRLRARAACGRHGM